MNRYTQLTPSQFNPLSLEEFMLVPSIKRKQHDQILASQEGIRQKLTEVDPLDVHQEEAIRLREEMNNKLDAQAQQLANQGVNPNSQADFLALNREYQNLIGPTGRIGQINTAKKVYAENFKNYMEDATKNKKWSRELALNNWYKNHHPKYTGYDDENNIINIGEYGAPEKVELMTKLKDVKSILGEQVVNEIAAGNYSITPGPNGSMQIVNRNGRRIETSNAPNIQNALDMLSSELYDPNSNWNKSLLFEGRTPEQMLRVSKDGKAYEGELMSGLNTMLTTKVTDNRSKNASLSGYKNQADWDEQHAVGQLIETTSSFLPNELAVNDYNQNNARLNTLLNKQKNNTLTKEENIELDKLQKFQITLNKRLESDTTYNEYKKYNDEAQKIAKKAGMSDPYATFNTGIGENFAAGQRWTFEKTADGKYQQVKHQQSTQGNWSKTKVGQPITASEKTILERGNNYNKKMQERRNELTKENAVMTTGYNMLPTIPNEEGLYRAFNNSFEQVLKNPEALRKYMSIETVDVDGKSVKPTPNDRDEIAQLYQEYGKDLKVTNMIPEDFNGKPGYIIEFQTGDNTYNMDGWSNGKIGGEGKTIRLKVNFNKEYGNVLGTINHYGLKYFESKGKINPETGMPIGMDLANKARENMYTHTTYNDVFNDPTYNWQNDQMVMKNMYNTVKKDIQKNGYKSVYSGINDLGTLMEIFKDHDGNKFIKN